MLERGHGLGRIRADRVASLRAVGWGRIVGWNEADKLPDHVMIATNGGAETEGGEGSRTVGTIFFFFKK